MKCKKSSCNGKPILRPLNKVNYFQTIQTLGDSENLITIGSLQPPSINGKNHFVGCSKWQPNEKFQHIYAPIPARVDETTLFQFMNDKSITLDQETELRQYEDSPCFAFRHPRHGKQKKCSQYIY